MAPNTSSNELLLEEEFVDRSDTISKAEPRTYHVVYWNIVAFMYYHIAGFYGLYLIFTAAKWPTIWMSFILFWMCGIGIIAGAHRLWSHKSYKATMPLQLFLMLFHSIANQHSVIHWARDHRIHHKYSDTDADPHNASRGFFYSHVGWLFVKKHPEVKKRGNTVDISDLKNNPVLAFQHRHNSWFIPLMAFGLTNFIPMYFWEESFSNAWHVNMFRYIINLNLTFAINSFTHLWGMKPYDEKIGAAQNRTLFYLTFGEGSHNYHHVFPYDYRSDELGLFNIVTKFIDFCALFGLAYDRKVVDKKIIKARAHRTGDGTVY